MKGLVATAILTCVAPPLFAQPSLSLDSAIQLALKNNRGVKMAAIEVRKAEEQTAATRTNRLPQLQFNAFESQLFTRLNFVFPAGAFGTFPGIGPVPSQNSSITTGRHLNTFLYGTASQPLSQLYKIGIGVHLQQLARDVNREKLEQQQQTVAFGVKQVYYGLAQAQSGLAAALESIELYKEVDREVAEGVAQQAALRADSLDVKTALAKAEYEAVTLRNNIADLEEQLNDLMGRDVRTEFRVEPAPESPEYRVDLESARAKALAQRSEIHQARLAIRQAEYDRALKKSEFIPDVSLNLTYLSPFSITVVPKNIAAAGLMLNWNVFDWGKKRHELGMKDQTIEEAKLRLQETEAQVVMEVDTRYRKLEQARSLLKVTQASMDAAKERLRVTNNRYAEKSALLKDVLQTKTALADADAQYQQALAGFWTTRAEFEKALGEQ